MNQLFKRYEKFAPRVPVYQISQDGIPTIHRFFDSSPVSPSGRFIALTEFPTESRLPVPGDQASVVVVDLDSGDKIYSTSTAAWDTQVGAQVQWGADDNTLLFNRIGDEDWIPYGVRVDPFSGSERRLNATIYHVSGDGRFSISPDLRKIGIAQPGYGVIVPADKIKKNDGASADDGIFLTNLEDGSAQLLVSLATIEQAIAPGRFQSGEGALYMFHTKWSADSSRIMAIVRWFPKNSRKSANWLLTMNADGSDIKVAIPPSVWSDGHHPNWYPGENRIVMNLPSATGPIGAAKRLIGKVGRRMPGHLRFGGVPLAFKAFNADGSKMQSLSREMGSGHPTIHPTGAFLMSDCYLYEPMAYKDGSVPLRAIGLISDTCVEAVRIDCKPTYAGPKNEYRIDPHPVWDRSGRYLIFNGAVAGSRAVFMADFESFYLDREHVSSIKV